jgi:hypothetical protein
MPIPCARCNMSLPEWELATNTTVVCTSCGASNEAHVFPAVLEVRAPAHSEIALAGEAACFDHAGQRAEAACRQCGRFLCPRCAIDFGDATWCPSCIAAGAGAAKAANLEASRTLYDSVALIVPLASLLVWPFTIVSGPAAVVLSILKWKAPLSVVRRSRWRFAAAILLGLAQTGAWIWGILYWMARVPPSV